MTAAVRASLSSKEAKPFTGDWDCVVERGQGWQRGEAIYEVVSIDKGRMDAIAVLDPVEPGHANEQKKVSASSLCNPLSGWERLPDDDGATKVDLEAESTTVFNMERVAADDGGETEIFKRPTRSATQVGLGPVVLDPDERASLSADLYAAAGGGR